MSALRLRRRLLIALLGVGLLPACSRPEPQIERFPPLALDSLGPEPLKFEALRGGALLVNYWATWCAPCRAEMASLERLSRRVAPRLRVVGIRIDEDLNLVREWLRKEKITFPNFADPGTRVSRPVLRIETLPETFLVAAGGRLIARTRGAREWDSEEIVAGLLRSLAEAG